MIVRNVSRQVGRGPWSRAVGSVVLAVALATGVAGCAAQSKYMQETAAGPIVAQPDAATVVFVRPSGFAGGLRATILDEKGRFLGDSLPESYFAVNVTPGEHVFISWAENTGALRANVAAGKIYFVEVSPKMGALSARVHLLGITPRAKSWAKLDTWMSESKAYAPDERSGQAYLAGRSDDVRERIRRANEALSEYSREELAERVIGPADGR